MCGTPPSQVSGHGEQDDQWVSLARHALEGDRDAFGKLVDLLTPSLYVTVRTRISPENQARLKPEDVVQETWHRAWSSRNRFEPTLGSFRAWLFGIARKVIMEGLRDRLAPRAVGTAGTSSAGLSDMPDEATSITRRVARDEALLAFQAWVEATLDPNQRRLLLLRGLEDREPDEVARLLGKTTAAVNQAWHRLRETIGEKAPPSIRKALID